MSSTTISDLSTYTTPSLTERCGEVYCSLNLERFFINCLRCAHQFSLVSCDLFIKHIKECLPAVLYDLSEQNSISQTLSSDNLARNELETTDQCTIQEIQIDPLMTIKHESEEVENKDETCDYVENPSDYENDDDLSLDKLRARKIVEGVIAEYKKHPILWDTKLRNNFKIVEITRAYRRIRSAVNSKYKTNFTHTQLRTQIQNLRWRYKKVLNKKEAFDKCHKDGTKHFETKLWFFDKLNFIHETNQDCKDDLSQGLKSEQEDSTSSNESCCSTNEPLPVRRVKRIKRDRPSCKMLNEADIILDIIRQYKQYPFLWDKTSPLYRVRYAKADAIRKITSHINEKFNKDITDKELRQQVLNLRAAYKHVQREKHKPNYQITLWYYNELSFIDSKAKIDENVADFEKNQSLKELNEPLKEEEASEISQVYNSDNRFIGSEVSQHDQLNKLRVSLIKSFHNEKKCQNDDLADENPADMIEGPLSCKKTNKQIVLSLIQEYAKHPCLWNGHKYNTKIDRYHAVKEITSAINAKHKTNFTSKKIQNTIVHLRSNYQRTLRKKEVFELTHSDSSRKFMPSLWYFNNMAFISRTDKRKSELKDENDENIQSDIESDCKSANSDLNSESEPERADCSQSSQTSITKNKPLLKAIIEEYKSRPCLWDESSVENTRERDLTNICNMINEQFSTELTYQSLDREMSAIISSHRRMLEMQEIGSNEEHNSNMWYTKLLSFIHNAESSESCQDKITEHSDLLEDKPVIVDNNSSDDEEEYQSSRPEPNKEMVFKIIELYKQATSLWDANHPQHKMQSERRKSIGGIIAKLSQEHDIHLTAEEFRYHIQFLKGAYFRAVRQEAIAKQSNLSGMSAVEKPFYFEEMSFLEPFADKNPADLQITEEKPHQFTFLCENKSLMMSFINLYKVNRCLWDPNHKDRNDPSAHSKAYSKIIKFFKKNGEHFPKKRLLSAIRFLHSTAGETLELNDENNTNKTPIWFYEHLNFLTKIPPNSDLNCTHCDKQFPCSVEYEKHKIEIIGDYPYKCKICNAGFVSRSKFSYHQITHKEPRKCELCGFQAFDNHNFNVHMRRHKRIHMFRCDECGKGFVTSSELNRHLRKHTGEKLFVCEICGMALVASSEYNHHMKRHRNERDHKCEICGSAFFTAKTLRCHMASHSSERQHVCDVCGSAFKRKKTLSQHMALHSDNKQYGCNICERRFAQKSGLHSHMKTHGQKI